MPRLRWIPIEANPEVMNEFAEKAGLVTSQDRFYDVYGLDDELLSLVPQPVKAVILLFPVLDDVDVKRNEADARIAKEGQHPIDNTVIWIKQTIYNACGTMAILHGLANTNVTLTPESPLAKLFEDCKGKTGFERAQVLENAELLGKIHDGVARSGQSTVPDIEVEVDFHYTCFVQAPSPPSREEGVEAPPGGQRLIELDGDRIGALDHGVCTDLLKYSVRVIRESYMRHTTNMGFTVIALAAAPSAGD